MEVTITEIVLIFVTMTLVAIMAKMNGAIKLMHNRMNLLSHAQKVLKRQLEAVTKTPIEMEFEEREKELQSRMEKDFRS